MVRHPSGVRRRGAAAVEFAVVSLVFFGIVLGVVEISRAMMVVEQLNGAAVLGARAGSLQGASSSDVQATVDAALKGQGLVDSSGNSLATVKVYDNGSVVYDSSSSPSAVSVPSGHTIKVEVGVTIAKATWLPSTLFFQSSNSLFGSAILVAE